MNREGQFKVVYSLTPQNEVSVGRSVPNIGNFTQTEANPLQLLAISS